MITAIIAAGLYPDSDDQDGDQWITRVCFTNQLFTALATVMTMSESWDLKSWRLGAPILPNVQLDSFVSVLPILLRAGLRPEPGFHMAMLYGFPSVEHFILCMSAFRTAGAVLESRRKNVKVLHDVLRSIGKGELKAGWDPDVVVQSFIDVGVEVDKGALKIATRFDLFTCAQRISQCLAAM